MSLASLFALLLAPMLGQAKITEIAAPGRVGAWALDDATGRIFASLEESGEVAEYEPASGQEVRRWAVGPEPGEMMVKGHRLVVAPRRPPALVAIDLKANRVEHTVPLAGKGPYALFCSRAANAYAYAICNTGDAWWDGELFQVDLDKGAVRHRSPVRGWRQSHPVHVAMSPDGRWMVPDARGVSGPSRADLLEVDEEKPAFRNVRGHHQSFGQIVAARAGRFWFLGNRLYPLDLTAETRSYSGTPCDLHGKLDLVAGAKAGSGGVTLVFETFSGAEPVGSLDIGRFIAPQGSAGRPAPDPLLRFDAERGRLCYGHGSRAVVVDLKSTGFTFRPLLLMELPAVASVELGGSLRLPLTVNAADASFQILQGPPGARIEAGALAWTPGPADVRSHEIRLQARAGASRDIATVRLDVTRPRVVLEHPVARLAIDASGRRAVAASGVNRETEIKLTLVDVERRSVIATRPTAQGVSAIHVDALGVYLAPAQGSVFHALKPEDLSDRGRTFLNQGVTAFGSLPDGRLIVAAGEERILFDARTLARLGTLRADRFSRPPAGAFQPLHDGALIGGQVYDASGKVVLRVGSFGLPTLTDHPRSSVPPLTLWNRTVAHGSLSHSDGRGIANWSGMGAVLLEGHPAAVSANTASTSKRQEVTVTLSLEVRDLVSGTPTEPILLYQGPVERPASGTGVLLRAAGTRVVAAHENMIFVVDVAEAVRNLPRPVVFRHAADPLEAGIDRSVPIRFQAEGGKGPLTYQLLFEYRGLSLNAKTGEVTVDVPLIWKGYAERLGKPAGFGAARVVGKEQAAAARELYKAMTGKATDAMPFELPIQLAAQDSEGQTAKLAATLLVLVPAADYEMALPAETKPPKPAPGPAQGDETKARLQKLEETVAQLTGKLEESRSRPPAGGTPAVVWVLIGAGWLGTLALAFILARRRP